MSTSEIDPSVQAELNRLRESIDNIDAAVVHMLAERFKATQQVGRLKADHRLPPADPARETRQIARLRQLAQSANLDPAFAEKLLTFIIAEVIRHHERIADEAENGDAGGDDRAAHASDASHAPGTPGTAGTAGTTAGA
ncbi:chorismate mutase [Streptomyces griseus]|uniref:chorismate mutase n=1 Tax=Streptomyces griseus TaxID=1911 RepID=UPI0033CCC04A